MQAGSFPCSELTYSDRICVPAVILMKTLFLSVYTSHNFKFNTWKSMTISTIFSLSVSDKTKKFSRFDRVPQLPPSLLFMMTTNTKNHRGSLLNDPEQMCEFSLLNCYVAVRIYSSQSVKHKAMAYTDIHK